MLGHGTSRKPATHPPKSNDTHVDTPDCYISLVKDRVGDGEIVGLEEAEPLAPIGRGDGRRWRPPPRASLYWKAFRRVALPEWFLINSALLVGPHVVNNHGSIFGLDARIYVRAAANWLAGADPWAAFANIYGVKTDFNFSGLPPTVAMYVPMTLVSEEVVVWGSIMLNALAALWIIRHLRLPLWWLMFPPTVQGVVAGNPHIVLLALALSGWSIVAGIAPVVKVYFIVPLIAELRLRALLAAGIFVLLLMPWTWALWSDYLSRAGTISARLMTEAYGGHSAWVYPVLLVIPTALALGLTFKRDRRAAGWLAVPGLWPASQWLYSACALPVMTPIAAALFAIDMRGVPPIAVIVCCIELWNGHVVSNVGGGGGSKTEPSNRYLQPA